MLFLGNLAVLDTHQEFAPGPDRFRPKAVIQMWIDCAFSQSSRRHAMSLQLRSLVRSNGELELSLVEGVVRGPAPDEVLIRIEAAPINPSDQGLLFGAADMSTAKFSGTAVNPVVPASIPERLMKAMAGRG